MLTEKNAVDSLNTEMSSENDNKSLRLMKADLTDPQVIQNQTFITINSP